MNNYKYNKYKYKYINYINQHGAGPREDINKAKIFTVNVKLQQAQEQIQLHALALINQVRIQQSKKFELYSLTENTEIHTKTLQEYNDAGDQIKKLLIKTEDATHYKEIVVTDMSDLHQSIKDGKLTDIIKTMNKLNDELHILEIKLVYNESDISDNNINFGVNNRKLHNELSKISKLSESDTDPTIINKNLQDKLNIENTRLQIQLDKLEKLNLSITSEDLKIKINEIKISLSSLELKTINYPDYVDESGLGVDYIKSILNNNIASYGKNIETSEKEIRDITDPKTLVSANISRINSDIRSINSTITSIKNQQGNPISMQVRVQLENFNKKTLKDAENNKAIFKLMKERAQLNKEIKLLQETPENSLINAERENSQQSQKNRSNDENLRSEMTELKKDLSKVQPKIDANSNKITEINIEIDKLVKEIESTT